MSAEIRNIQKIDAVRAFFSGPGFPLRETVAMLVLIEYFSASNILKTALPLFLQSGYLITALSSSVLRRRQWKTNRILAGANILSFIGMLIAACCSSSLLFIFFVAIPPICEAVVYPLLTQMYGGYEKEKRGLRYSSTAIARFVGSILFAFLAQVLLGKDISFYKVLLVVYGSSFLVASFFSFRLPSVPINGERFQSHFADFGLLRRDRLFAWVSIAWFFMGFANLWLLPYRTNFLVEKQFGFAYTPSLVIILTVIIPYASRIFALPVIGWLFDRMNLIVLRIIVNLAYAFYILLFFYGGSLIYQVMGSLFLGIGLGGSGVLWHLWVTKLAEPDKVASYMSVHTSLTGVRMFIAPLLGLWSLNTLGPQTCALIAVSLIGVSILLLIPLIGVGRSRFRN